MFCQSSTVPRAAAPQEQLEYLLSQGHPEPQGVEPVFWNWVCSVPVPLGLAGLAGLVLPDGAQGREDSHRHLLCCSPAEVAVRIPVLENILEGGAALVLERSIARSLGLALSEDEQLPAEGFVESQGHLDWRKRFLVLNHHPCPRWVEDTVLGIAFCCLSEDLALSEEDQLSADDIVELLKQAQGRVKRFLLPHHLCTQWVEPIAFRCSSWREEQPPVEHMVEPRKQYQTQLLRGKRFLLPNHPCPRWVEPIAICCS